MVEIVWPTVSAPGRTPQDGAGRLINVYAETRPNDEGTVWRRAPGAVIFTVIHPATARWTGKAFIAFDSTQDLIGIGGVGST